MRNWIVFMSLILVASCVVTKKKYKALEQELVQLKTDLKDDDRDGVPNYLDLEPSSDSLASVDLKGRSIKIQQVVDMDGDGVLDVNDFCPTIKGIAAANGCPDQDGDGVYDFVDKCKTKAGLKSLDGCPESVTFTGKPKTHPPAIYFEGKTLKFRSVNRETPDSIVHQIAEIMLQQPSYVLELKSYTDPSGDSLKNRILCEKRANLVKTKFMQQGVPERRLIVKVLGSQNPNKSDENKKGRAANNRVEFLIRFE